MQLIDGGYRVYRDNIQSLAEAKSQLNALDYSGIPNLYLVQYYISVPEIKQEIKEFKLTLTPIRFNL